MPYIKPERRQVLENDIRVLAINIVGPGELNYVITKLSHRYIEYNEFSYRVLNEVIGVLECAKEELYRRVVVPYEEEKILENGDIDAPTAE